MSDIIEEGIKEFRSWERKILLVGNSPAFEYDVCVFVKNLRNVLLYGSDYA